MGSKKVITLENSSNDFERNRVTFENFTLSYGNHFFEKAEDFKKLVDNGFANFSFITDHYYYIQQKFILSIAVYISQFIDYRITIYSQDIFKNYFSTLLRQYYNFEQRAKVRTFKVSKNIYIVNINDFTKRSREYIKTLDEPATIQFWDLPPCEKFTSSPEAYHKLINSIDHITIISDRDSNNPREMATLKFYFESNKINFKHYLFENQKKSKFTNIFRELFDRMIS